MELDIENFGSINEAHIKLRKINIIAGVNGSGKSTSSKLLSCFLTANSKDGHYLSNNSIYERFVSFIAIIMLIPDVGINNVKPKNRSIIADKRTFPPMLSFLAL